MVGKAKAASQPVAAGNKSLKNIRSRRVGRVEFNNLQNRLSKKTAQKVTLGECSYECVTL